MTFTAIPAEVITDAVRMAKENLGMEVRTSSVPGDPFGVVVDSMPVALGFMTSLVVSLDSVEDAVYWDLVSVVKVETYSQGVVLTFPGFRVG